MRKLFLACAAVLALALPAAAQSTAEGVYVQVQAFTYPPPYGSYYTGWAYDPNNGWASLGSMSDNSYRNLVAVAQHTFDASFLMMDDDPLGDLPPSPPIKYPTTHSNLAPAYDSDKFYVCNIVAPPGGDSMPFYFGTVYIFGSSPPVGVQVYMARTAAGIHSQVDENWGPGVTYVGP